MATALLERKLISVNPFDDVSIPKEGLDAKKKSVLSLDELRTALKTAMSMDDDLRLLAVLMSHTGMRIGEAAGLRRSDCKKSGDITYVRVEPHDLRGLKTETSKREIPIVGRAKEALASLLRQSEGQEYLFGRYAYQGEVRADAASASLNKRIRRVTNNQTLSSHCFRHTIEDLMIEANVPKPVQTAIGGWGKSDMSDNYGKGYSLRVKKESLEAALLPLNAKADDRAEAAYEPEDNE